MELADDFKTPNESLHNVELGRDSIMTVIEQGWPNLRILVQIEAVQVFASVLILRVSNYIDDFLRLHLCWKIKGTLDEQHDPAFLNQLVYFLSHR